jgi:hypothetical protein
MLKKTFTVVVTILTCFTAFSQTDSTTTPSPAIFSGSVDAYYRYNFANAKDAEGNRILNNYTSFTNSQNSFELGMASIRADHSFGKVGATVDLGFGKRAEEFSYNDKGTMAAIKQLYVTYTPVNNLKFTAGKWATHFDSELPDAYLNRNYSMSYLFSYGPFFHTGLKGELTSGQTVFMLGIANPADYTTTTSAHKHIIAQVAFTSKDSKLKLYLNYHGGRSSDSLKMNAFNLTAFYAVTPKFNIVSNSSLKLSQSRSTDKWSSANKWWGSVLYLNVDPVNWLGLTLRGEYFNDEESLAGFGGNIFESTLSANFRINNLTIIPEFRIDNASNDIFFEHDGTATKSTGTFVMGVTYHF